LLAKAAALCASLVQNHPSEILATIDEEEGLILELAAGRLRREDVLAWLQNHTKSLEPNSAG
jgi:prophage maintenance system killer protein